MTPRPGYKTTEFWMTAVVLVLTNLKTLPFPSKYNWIVDVGALFGYALSRGLAKQGGADPAPAQVAAPTSGTGTEALDEIEVTDPTTIAKDKGDAGHA